MTKTTYLVELALLILIAVSSVSANDNPDPAAVERGRKAFIASCGFCHGNDATGNRAPDLIRSPLVNRDASGNLIGPVIKNGRPEKEMPAFPALSAQQVSDMVAFLHARLREALASSHVPSDYPVEKLLTGNAAQGKNFFNGAGGCAGCHSPGGDLAGIAKKYSAIELQSRFLYPRRAQSTVTVKTKSGEQFEGKLLHIDEFDLEMTDQAGWHHSWPRNEVQYTVHDPLERHRELLRKYTDADMHNMFAYLETFK
jgi:cytochrome c oxidase cbb3-type subunit 3